MLWDVSYDLVFWRYQSGSRRDPASIYDELLSGATPEDLEELPLEPILSKILAAFPGARREPNGPDMEWIDWVSSDEDASFQVEWTTRYIVVSCRPLLHDIANRLIDIFDEVGCPLYDPQTEERFDSTLPTESGPQ
jgi:hypothetical protein